MSEPQPGEQLDHYRIDALVTRSGMASIYSATDVATGQHVAIKVPHLEMESDPVFYERFLREEEIGARLSHSGVARVFENPQRSRLYMVSEWVEGRLLRNILRTEAPLTAERSVRITLSICDTLQYIHDQSIAHRDLKPENIMVDDQDRTKIIDFGLASNIGVRRLTFAKLSQAMGTPDYISPEQVKGKRGDARSDIYSLGVMLYEMLTGAVPFQGSNAFAVMNDRVLNYPVPPREVNPAISPELQEVLYRALERDPARRYARASEFAWDLRHLDQVTPADRVEAREWRHRRQPARRQALFYGALALIPIIIFLLLLYAGRR